MRKTRRYLHALILRLHLPFLCVPLRAGNALGPVPTPGDELSPLTLTPATMAATEAEVLGAPLSAPSGSHVEREAAPRSGPVTRDTSCRDVLPAPPSPPPRPSIMAAAAAAN